MNLLAHIDDIEKYPRSLKFHSISVYHLMQLCLHCMYIIMYMLCSVSLLFGFIFFFGVLKMNFVILYCSLLVALVKMLWVIS